MECVISVPDLLVYNALNYVPENINEVLDCMPLR